MDLKSKQEVSRIKSELKELRTQVDKRGFGIFKHGNIKRDMDETLSMNTLRNLKEDVQSCLDAYSDISSRFFPSDFPSVQPVIRWNEAYERKQNQFLLRLAREHETDTGRYMRLR